MSLLIVITTNPNTIILKVLVKAHCGWHPTFSYDALASTFLFGVCAWIGWSVCIFPGDVCTSSSFTSLRSLLKYCLIPAASLL